MSDLPGTKYLLNGVSIVTDRKAYEDDLARRQKEHIDNINPGNRQWQPCMHDSCGQCVGTGVKQDGTPCVHHISCPCPKCSPSMVVLTEVDENISIR